MNTKQSKSYSIIRNIKKNTLYRSAKGFSVDFPALSPSMEAGKIVKWMKQPGDKIVIGDVLFSVETDKAVMDFEMTEEGTLAKILVEEGTADVPVNSPVAVMVEEGEDWNDVTYDEPVKKEDVKVTTTPTPAPAPVQNNAVKETVRRSSNKTLSPAVGRLMRQYAISETDVSPSGPKSNILKGDVLSYIQSKNLQPVKEIATSKSDKAQPAQKKETKAIDTLERENSYIDIENSKMRQVIAQRLTSSKFEIPHGYILKNAPVDALLKLRKLVNDDFGMKISVNDLIIKSVAKALEANPDVNINVVKGNVQKLDKIDISVAVAIEGGLITPILKDANHKGLNEINSTVKELANLAKAGKLTPEQYQGGSFTISNLGMFGISNFTAVINPPQGAILAVGGLDENVKMVDEKLSIEKTISLHLSYNTAAISEDSASNFMDTLADNIKEVNRLLL